MGAPLLISMLKKVGFKSIYLATSIIIFIEAWNIIFVIEEEENRIIANVTHTPPPPQTFHQKTWRYVKCVQKQIMHK